MPNKLSTKRYPADPVWLPSSNQTLLAMENPAFTDQLPTTTPLVEFVPLTRWMVISFLFIQHLQCTMLILATFNPPIDSAGWSKTGFP